MTDAEKEKVRFLHASWIESWNERSADAMAELLAEDVNMVGFDGSQMNGRESVQSMLGQIFKDYPTGRYVTIVEEIRPLGTEVMLLRAVVGMVPRGYADINPVVNAVQTLIAHKAKDGEWEIAVFHNTPAAFHGRPEESEKLTTRLREAMAKVDFLGKA